MARRQTVGCVVSVAVLHSGAARRVIINAVGPPDGKTSPLVDSGGMDVKKKNATVKRDYWQ